MLLLAHTGITLGTAALISFTQGNRPGRIFDRLLKWPIYLGKSLDVRILLIGSLLPDIIDKPIGQFFFKETFRNGRIFSHTLLFLIIITAAGLYVFKAHKKSWLFVLSFGTFMHLLLDQMWESPETLFWPLFGLTFEKGDITDWVQNILLTLFIKPGVYIPELIGMVVLIWLTIILQQRKNVYAFLRYGKV